MKKYDRLGCECENFSRNTTLGKIKGLREKFFLRKLYCLCKFAKVFYKGLFTEGKKFTKRKHKNRVVNIHFTHFCYQS